MGNGHDFANLTRSLRSESESSNLPAEELLDGASTLAEDEAAASGVAVLPSEDAATGILVKEVGADLLAGVGLGGDELLSCR